MSHCRRRASLPSPTLATPPRARYGRRIPGSRRPVRLARSCTAAAAWRAGRRADATGTIVGSAAGPSEEGHLEGAPDSQSGWYERLRGWGLPVSDKYKVVSDLAEVRAYIDYYAEPGHRHETPYEIDGVVVKIDPIETQRPRGATGRP